MSDDKKIAENSKKVTFRTWNEEQGQIAARNKEAAERILQAAGITPDNPDYQRWYNTTLQNVHNTGRFGVYDDNVEQMFVGMIKDPEATIEKYEATSAEYKNMKVKEQLTNASGGFAHAEQFSYQQSQQAIAESMHEGIDMRAQNNVKFPDEFYDEKGGLRRLVYEIPAGQESGAGIINQALQDYDYVDYDKTKQRFIVDGKQEVGPSKFFANKQELLEKKFLDVIGKDKSALDLADTELLNVIKSGDYQAFNELRKQRGIAKDKRNLALRNALSDKAVFRDVSKVLAGENAVGDESFINQVKGLAEDYGKKASVIHQDASKAAWGAEIDRVMLSATPYDVATQSTFRDWQSCMHTTGCNWQYVDDSIGAGSIVAYGYNSQNPQKMVSRVLLHPYTNDEGEVAYFANNRVYGEENATFREAVKSVENKFNEGKGGVFQKANGVYNDGDAAVRWMLSEDYLKNTENLRLSDFSIPEGMDLSKVKNLTLEGNISFGRNVKLPEKINFPEKLTILGKIPDRVNLSAVKELTVGSNVEFAENVKLPEKINFPEKLTISGKVPDGVDLSAVKELTVGSNIEFAENMKWPKKINFPEKLTILGKIPDRVNLSAVKELTVGSNVEFAENMKWPEKINFPEKLTIPGKVPDGVDLSAVKELTVGSNVEFAENVKWPEKINFPEKLTISGKVPDKVDLSAVKDLTVGSNVEFSGNVKLPEKINLPEKLTISGKIPDGLDLSNVSHLSFRDDNVTFGNGVKLPEYLTVSGKVPDGADLSGVKKLAFEKDVTFGKNVKLNDKITITSAIPDGIDLSSAKELELGIFGRLGKDVKLPDTVVISSEKAISEGADLSGVKNLKLEFVKELPEGVKLPEHIQCVYDVPKGDLSGVKSLTLKNVEAASNVLGLPEGIAVKYEGGVEAKSNEVAQRILKQDLSDAFLVVGDAKVLKGLEVPQGTTILVIDEAQGKVISLATDDKAKKIVKELDSENPGLKIEYVSAEEFEKQSGAVFSKAKGTAEVTQAAEGATEAAIKEAKEKAAEAVAKFEEKTAINAGAAAAKATAEEVAKKSSILSKAAAANAKFDRTVDKVVEKGTETLNNSSVGKAYEKAATKVGETKAAKTVAKAASKVVDKAASTAAGKAVTKVVAKTAETAVVKSVLKKIPLVSVGAGAVFAWQRIKNGEWKAAGCEMLSGIAGCFPGVGTAASVALDCGLAANDIHNSIQKDDKKPEEKIAQAKPLPKPVPKPAGVENKEEKKEVKKTTLTPEQLMALKENARS